MAVTVYGYDEKLIEVTSSSVEFEEQDISGTVIDTKTNTLLTPGTSEYGVRLSAPSLPTAVVVWVDDTAGKYAPATISTLHGGKSISLHVTLYALPKAAKLSSRGPSRGPSSNPPSSPPPAKNLQEVEALISVNVQSGQWTILEAEAVHSLITSVTSAVLSNAKSSIFLSRVVRWVNTLQSLGIELLLPKQSNEQGGNNQPIGPLVANVEVEEEVEPEGNAAEYERQSGYEYEAY